MHDVCILIHSISVMHESRYIRFPGCIRLFRRMYRDAFDFSHVAYISIITQPVSPTLHRDDADESHLFFHLDDTLNSRLV